MSAGVLHHAQQSQRLMSSSKNNTSKDFPPQNRTYKIKVKNGAGWRSFNACRLQISVGQSKQTGEKFVATLEWATQRFQSTTICVNDTLQRFNLMHDLNLTEDAARKRSIFEGDRWLEKNFPKGSQNAAIIRWDAWTTRTDFPSQLDIINTLYKECDSFRAAVQKEIEDFALRKKGPKHNNFYNLCRQFLIEETAAFAMMIREQEAVDIYPGTTLLPLRMIQEGEIAEVNFGNRSHFTRIDFIRRNACPRPTESTASSRF